MNKIFKHPEKYIFPNYCFEKQYRLLYLSDFILSGKENTNTFFTFLNMLNQANTSTSSDVVTKNNYEVLIPFDVDYIEKGHLGDCSFKMSRGIMHFDFESLRTFFDSFKYLDGTIINLKNIIDQFWIKSSTGKFEIFVSMMLEIVIVGIDMKLDISFMMKQDNYSMYFYNSLEDYINNVAISKMGMQTNEVNQIRTNYL